MSDATPPRRDLESDTWVATDALGRTLPGVAECGPPRPGKTVGLFYFLWLGAHDRDLHDISRLRAADPDAPAYGPPGVFHWWGEPHLGYYRSDDEFVIRKHAQMLTEAGVDVLILDVTNGLTYDETLMTLCRVFRGLRRLGQPTPQLAFLANSGSARVVQHLYDTFYAPGLFPELWFHWQGKPLMLAPTEGVPLSVQEFFTWRQSWAWTEPDGWFGDGRDKWPWLDHHPQRFGWHDAPDRPEQISVNVAQHPVSNIGRSFHDGAQPPPGAEQPARGLCFDEQWRRAREVDPDFVLITGWNEWVAQRFLKEAGQAPAEMMGVPLQPGDSFFVDQYSHEFSRDIEPMRGGHGDAYYYQMVANIRRFKGVRPRPKASAPRRIDIGGTFRQWDEVGPEFRDSLGDAARRHPGWGDHVYVNDTLRNKWDVMKVARDDDFLYFYARTVGPLRLPAGEGGMWLLLNTNDPTRPRWEGYDFLVRVLTGPGTGRLERSAGGWNWEPVAEVRVAIDGNELMLAVPRAMLGLGLGGGPLRLDLKWADSVPESGDISDFLDGGDAAPDGRFNYRYEE